MISLYTKNDFFLSLFLALSCTKTSINPLKYGKLLLSDRTICLLRYLRKFGHAQKIMHA